MRKFLKSSLLFLIPLLLLNLFFYKITNELYYEPYTRHPNFDNFTTFIFADSHGEPLDNFLTDQRIYNFSAASDSYSDMLRKLVFLIKNHKVERVILTADDHTLSNYRQNSNNSERSIQFVDFEDIQHIDYSSDRLSYLKEKYLTNYVVLLNSKSKGILWTYFKGFLKTNGRKEANNDDWSRRGNRKRAAENRVRVQFVNVQESEDQRRSLVKIIKLCKENNVELIGLKFPLSRDYIDAMDDKTFGSDSILVSQNIKVLDFKTLFETQDSLFANQDHLNKIGGKLFSKKVLEALEGS